MKRHIRFTIILALSAFLIAGSLQLGTEILGWKSNQQSEIYTADNLYEYINGDSESFLAFGFEKVYVHYYSKEDKELVVELYDMGTPLNALGVFRSRRGITSCGKELGMDSDVGENEIVFVKGKYYVKLYFFDTWKGSDRELLKIARFVADKIPGQKKFPEQFSVFPRRGLIPCSFAYFPSNYLNLENFNSVFEATYKKGGKTFKLFYSFSMPSLRLKREKVLSGNIEKDSLPTGKALYLFKESKLIAGTDSYKGLQLLKDLVRQLKTKK